MVVETQSPGRLRGWSSGERYPRCPPSVDGVEWFAPVLASELDTCVCVSRLVFRLLERDSMFKPRVRLNNERPKKAMSFSRQEEGLQNQCKIVLKGYGSSVDVHRSFPDAR